MSSDNTTSPRHPADWAVIQPDKPAYIMADSGISVSYRQLDQASNQIARLFRQCGLQPGDHIALLSENNEHFFKVAWAAQRSGLIYTPIHTHLQIDEVTYILNNCQAKLFVVSEQFTGIAQQLVVKNTQVKDIFCLTDNPHYSALMHECQQLPTTAIDDQVAGTHMLYSSGTTGKPKGILPDWVPGKFNDFPAMLKQAGEFLGLSRDSVYMAPAPLYHAAPLATNLTNMALGGTSVIMSKFDPELALAAIDKYQVSHSQWVPIMFIRLLRLPKAVRERYNISSLQQAVHSAAPCPTEVKRQMIHWWGPIITEYYAASEAIGMTYITSEEWLSHPGSVGRAVLGNPHIVSDDDRELPAGEIGTIYFSGTQAFEYYGDEAKTQSSSNHQYGATTGDLGYLDKDGYLYLTDRQNFMIISGGVNIYPQEIENLLITHPDIADAAVFGVPSPEFGEEVKAVVELLDWQQASNDKATEIMAWCKERLSSVKTPKSIDFDKQLPRQENGKLYKMQLKKRYWPE